MEAEEDDFSPERAMIGGDDSAVKAGQETKGKTGADSEEN